MQNTRSSFLWLLISALLCIVLAGCGDSAPSQDARSRTAQAASSTPANMPPLVLDWGVDGVCGFKNWHECMVYVPAGRFLMGAQGDDREKPNFDPAANKDEQPVHEVRQAAFWMHKQEVKVRMFKRCVRAKMCDESEVISGGGYFNYKPPEKSSYSINGVSWTGAAQYCHWIWGRLPTEEEWEYAAVGSTGWRFPWGNDPARCVFANFAGGGGFCKEYGTYVHSKDFGKSIFEVQDLAGNVWEWTRDRYEKDAYTDKDHVAPKGSDETIRRVIRGGGWMDMEGVDMRPRQRASLKPDSKESDVGFRCVRDNAEPKLRAGGPFAPAYRVTIPRMEDPNGQEAALYLPPGSTKSAPSPLIVYAQDPFATNNAQRVRALLNMAQEHRVALLVPDIAPPGARPRIPGGPRAVDYLWNAVRFVQDHSPVDHQKVILVGAGGGAQNILLLLERYPGKPVWTEVGKTEPWGGILLVDPVVDPLAFHAELVRAKRTEELKLLESWMNGSPDGEAAAAGYRDFAPIHHIKKVIGQKLTVYSTLTPNKGLRSAQQLAWLDTLGKYHVGRRPRLSDQSILLAWQQRAGTDGPATRALATYGRITHMAHEEGSRIDWWAWIRQLTP